jgi:hypothetical protein
MAIPSKKYLLGKMRAALQKPVKHKSQRVGLCADNDPTPEEIAESRRIQAEIRDGWSDQERIKRYWKKPAALETTVIEDSVLLGAGNGPSNTLQIYE